MAEHPVRRPEPSMVGSVVRVVLWVFLCFWAFMGPLCVLMAAVSFVYLPSWMEMTYFNGEAVRSTQQKVVFLCVGVLISIVGIGGLLLMRQEERKGSA